LLLKIEGVSITVLSAPAPLATVQSLAAGVSPHWQSLKLHRLVVAKACPGT
jgi:small ligand-binding sensory domain FIST